MSRIALGLVLAAAPAFADVPRPPALRDIGIEEHVGAQLPLDLPFLEARGRRVQLGELFDGKRPVLLVLAYVRCKMLCSLVLHEATTAVREMPLELGTDYRVVTVSIDPDEEASIANARRAELLRRAGHPDETDRWTFLLGADRPIRLLADSLGFRYRWDPATEQFAHPAVLFVVTPDGKIARYLQGIEVAPAVVATALRDAARGEVSTASLTETVLSCFRFDPAARARREQIDRYLKIGGAVLVLALGAAVAGLALWERRRRRAS